jgi:hypothetical protein
MDIVLDTNVLVSAMKSSLGAASWNLKDFVPAVTRFGLAVETPREFLR